MILVKKNDLNRDIKNMKQDVTGVYSLPVASRDSLDRIRHLGDAPDYPTAVSFSVLLGGMLLSLAQCGANPGIRRADEAVRPLDLSEKLSPAARNRWLASRRFDVRITLPGQTFQMLEKLCQGAGYAKNDSLDGESAAMTACIEVCRETLERIKYPDARLVWTLDGQSREFETSLFPYIRAKFADEEARRPAASLHVLRPRKPSSGPG